MNNSSDQDEGTSVLTLVQYAQRVAGLHIELIDSLESLRFDLVKPILEKSSAEQLEHFEETSPHLQGLTQDAWRAACLRQYPEFAARYEKGQEDEPLDWKSHHYFLADEAARRMEEITSKLRIDRAREEERKKDKEVKITDRLPPAKRRRCWGMPTQPKTLFEKTRSEATRVSKTAPHARILPNSTKIVPNSLASRVPILPPLPKANIASSTTRSPQPALVNVVRRRSTMSSSLRTTDTSSFRSKPSGCSMTSTRLSGLPLAPPVKPMHALANSSSAPSACPFLGNRSLPAFKASSAAPARAQAPALRNTSSFARPTSSPIIRKYPSALPQPQEASSRKPLLPDGSSSSPPPVYKAKDPMSLLFMPKRRPVPHVATMASARTS